MGGGVEWVGGGSEWVEGGWVGGGNGRVSETLYDPCGAAQVTTCYSVYY